MTHILLRHRDIPDINKLEVYKKNGGLAAFKKAVTKMQPAECATKTTGFVASTTASTNRAVAFGSDP